MSNTRYLEIDSTYRNRNDWPLPANFEVPISQTGRKNIYNALDPVSLLRYENVLMTEEAVKKLEEQLR